MQGKGGTAMSDREQSRHLVSGTTRLVGVMGWPVSHSRSPGMHNAALSAAGIDAVYAARLCFATWPEAQTPKMHYSTQRTAEREIGRPGKDGAIKTAPAKPGQHDDWIDGDDFTTFLGEIGNLSFDAMLEAKQKDLALLRLRDSIRRAGLTEVIW